jgi:hypothetical protein
MFKKMRVEIEKEEKNEGAESPHLSPSHQEDYKYEQVDKKLGFEMNIAKNYYDKQRTLLVGSRGVAPRHRFLQKDIFRLLPTAKQEVNCYYGLWVKRSKGET